MRDMPMDRRTGALRRLALRAAALVTLLTAAAFVPPALPASAACPDGGYAGTPGQRVKSPTNATVYMIDPAGYKRRIPNPTTYNQFFRDWNGIITTAETTCYWTGPEIEVSIDFLARTNGGAYYWVETTGPNQVARWIPSSAVYDKYHFSWSKPGVLSQQWFDDHRGPNWT
jgi:hypothetical protein